MLTIPIFQTLDFNSVHETLTQYSNPESLEAQNAPVLSALLDFLSPAAKASMVKNIAQQVVESYSTDQTTSSLVAQTLEMHALGALLSTQWRMSLVEAVSKIYPDLTEDLDFTALMN